MNPSIFVRAPVGSYRALLQRGISELDAANVRDVFALRQFAVNMHAWQRLDTPNIDRQPLCDACHIPAADCCRPPVAQISDLIELPALIVKSVRHFVSDYRAHAAVVDGVIGFRIEERRLQDSRRENDLVHHGVVIGVHRRRRHSPFAAIDRFADFLRSRFASKFAARMAFETYEPLSILSSE